MSEGACVVVSVIVDYSNGAQKVFSCVKVPGEQAYAAEALQAAAAMAPGLVLDAFTVRNGDLALRSIDGLGGGGVSWSIWLDQTPIRSQLPSVSTVNNSAAPLVHGQTLHLKLVKDPEAA